MINHNILAIIIDKVALIRWKNKKQKINYQYNNVFGACKYDDSFGSLRPNHNFQIGYNGRTRYTHNTGIYKYNYHKNEWFWCGILPRTYM